MTRFVAIDCMPYDTWRMRLTLTLLIFAALALLPVPASAFELEESLKAQHSQYQLPSQRPRKRTSRLALNLWHQFFWTNKTTRLIPFL